MVRLFVALLASAWTDKGICIDLHGASSKQIERLEVAADPVRMSQFMGTLRERFAKGTIGLVSGQSKGAPVKLLTDWTSGLS